MNKKIKLLSKLLIFPFLFSNFISLAMENQQYSSQHVTNHLIPTSNNIKYEVCSYGSLVHNHEVCNLLNECLTDFAKQYQSCFAYKKELMEFYKNVPTLAPSYLDFLDTPDTEPFHKPFPNKVILDYLYEKKFFAESMKYLLYSIFNILNMAMYNWLAFFKEMYEYNSNYVKKQSFDNHKQAINRLQFDKCSLDENLIDKFNNIKIQSTKDLIQMFCDFVTYWPELKKQLSEKKYAKFEYTFEENEFLHYLMDYLSKIKINNPESHNLSRLLGIDVMKKEKFYNYCDYVSKNMYCLTSQLENLAESVFKQPISFKINSHHSNENLSTSNPDITINISYK